MKKQKQPKVRPEPTSGRASASSKFDCSGPGGFYWGEIPPSITMLVLIPRELQR